MKDYSSQNKMAWEYSAYDFWMKESVSPVDRAQKIMENPKGMLKRYALEVAEAANVNIDFAVGDVPGEFTAVANKRV